MSKPILVTGSQGLIGRNLCRLFDELGVPYVGVDIRAPGEGCVDITDPVKMTGALGDVRGVIHLAAISRVVWGERDPARCMRVNHQASVWLIDHLLAQSSPPWFLYASSREVYGQASVLPVREGAALSPLNVYARSKCQTERYIKGAPKLRAGVLRFSSVYGDARDHEDRVLPAFARAAACGGALRLDGTETTLDFTHVADVVQGIHEYARRLDVGAFTPTLHLCSGVGTTLLELARLARQCSNTPLELKEAAPRDYDVHRFIGDPTGASRWLDWRARISLEAGFSALVNAYKQQAR